MYMLYTQKSVIKLFGFIIALVTNINNGKNFEEFKLGRFLKAKLPKIKTITYIIFFQIDNVAKYQIIKSKDFYNYTLLLVLTISLIFGLIGLFNLVIDPYGIFNMPRLFGINQAKVEKIKSGRLFKATDIIHIKPKAIFLGSSRAEYGLEPTHPALQNLQPSYNTALGAATPYELQYYLEHAIVNQPQLKLVIIGLDEFMFNEFNTEGANFSRNRLRKKYLTIQDILNSTFSLKAAQASFDNIQYSSQYPEYESYTKFGRLNLRLIDRDNNATLYRFNKSIETYFNTFDEYKISYKYLSNIQNIINICKQNNIKLYFFISPSHATRYEIIYTAKHWKMYEQVKRELVKITPIWDFSGYSMENYIDDSHYLKHIGDLVINRILSYQTDKVPNDFGVLLTPKNIENHLIKMRKNREIWSKNNPEEVAMVKKVELRVKAKKNPK